MGNDNILMVVFLAIAAYYILVKKDVRELLTGTKTVTPEQAKTISPAVYNALKPCAPMDIICQIQGLFTTETASTPTPAEVISSIPVSEWSGTPKVAICPYDSTLLVGDRRCQMPTPGAQSLTTGISPFTGQSWMPDSWSWW